MEIQRDKKVGFGGLEISLGGSVLCYRVLDIDNADGFAQRYHVEVAKYPTCYEPKGEGVGRRRLSECYAKVGVINQIPRYIIPRKLLERL